jgi:hypothetical protein
LQAISAEKFTFDLGGVEGFLAEKFEGDLLFVALRDVPDASGKFSGLPQECSLQSVHSPGIIAKNGPVGLLPVPVCPIIHDAKQPLDTSL